MRGKWIAVFLTLLLAIPLAGYTLATGSRGGMYFEVGRLLTKYLKSKRYEITLRPSRGSMENCRLLENKEVDLAIVQSNVALWAYKGYPIYEKYAGGSCRSVRALAILYPEMVQMIVPDDSVIDSTMNIQGMKIVVGEYGSSTVEDVVAVIQRYGLTFKDFTPQYYPLRQAVDSLMTGSTDAIFYTGGAPSRWAEELSKRYSVRWVSLSDRAIHDLAKYYPYYHEAVIPMGVYPFQGEPVETISCPSLLCCRDDLSIDEAYQITRLFWEKVDEYKLEYPALQYLDPKTAWRDTAIPLHPGAQLYYRERGWMK